MVARYVAQWELVGAAALLCAACKGSGEGSPNHEEGHQESAEPAGQESAEPSREAALPKARDRWERNSVFHDPRPFGPGFASFPWHCAFSPDGKWVAFLESSIEGDGPNGGSLSVWSVNAGREAWRISLDAGGFEVVFADDSRRFATVARDALLVVALGADGWAIERRVPLGFDTSTSCARCPRPFCFASWEGKAFFAENDVGYVISFWDGRIERTSGASEKVSAYVRLPGRAVAEVLAEPFETRITREGRTEQVLEGALVCASPDGRTWLIAPNPRAYPWGPVDLALVDARDGSALARFEVGRKDGVRLQFRRATFSPDGQWLAFVYFSGPGRRHAGPVGSILLSTGRTGEGRQVIMEDVDLPGQPEGLAFTADGRLITASRPWGDDARPNVLLWERRR